MSGRKQKVSRQESGRRKNPRGSEDDVMATGQAAICEEPNFEKATNPNSGSSREDAVHEEVRRRIFVNRELDFSKIKVYVFDLDHTLAPYLSPAYEALQFDISIKGLIESKSYPAEIKSRYKYEHEFALRDAWFDKLYGNTLKVDQSGGIIVAFHGFQELSEAKVDELYPDRSITPDHERVFIPEVLYTAMFSYLLPCLVDYFDNCGEYTAELTGVRKGDQLFTYQKVFKDCRDVSLLYSMKDFRQRTLDDIQKYLEKDERLPKMLQQLRQRGSKVFMLSNAGFSYVNAIMSYLLHDPANPNLKWLSYFDVVINGANKPFFFVNEGIPFIKIDPETAALKETMRVEPGRFSGTGHVLSGGSCDILTDWIGVKGNEVLLVDDQLYTQTFNRNWRKFMVVPELNKELPVWVSNRHWYKRLQQLDKLLSDLYRFPDQSGVEPASPADSSRTREIQVVKDMIKRISREVDSAYGRQLGSVFRSGLRQTRFADLLHRHSDVYASSALNLLYYPANYVLKEDIILSPHETAMLSI